MLYWLQVSLQPDCKNLGSGVPSLMVADKPCPQLQPSLLCWSLHGFSGRSIRGHRNMFVLGISKSRLFAIRINKSVQSKWFFISLKTIWISLKMFRLEEISTLFFVYHLKVKWEPSVLKCYIPAFANTFLSPFSIYRFTFM